MDLQSVSGKPGNSDNACPPTHFRAYSPQIADHIRRQPDSPANNSRVHYFAPRRRDPMPQTRAIMVEIAHQLNSTEAERQKQIDPCWLPPRMMRRSEERRVGKECR